MIPYARAGYAQRNFFQVHYLKGEDGLWHCPWDDCAWTDKRHHSRELWFHADPKHLEGEDFDMFACAWCDFEASNEIALFRHESVEHKKEWKARVAQDAANRRASASFLLAKWNSARTANTLRRARGVEH